MEKKLSKSEDEGKTWKHLLYRCTEEIHSETELTILWTEVVQSNKYYKSRAVGVTYEIGLTPDRVLSELTVLKKHDIFRDTGSHVIRATIQDHPNNNASKIGFDT